MARKRKYPQRTKLGRKRAAQRRYLAGFVKFKRLGQCDHCDDKDAIHEGKDNEGKPTLVCLKCLAAHWEAEQ